MKDTVIRKGIKNAWEYKRAALLWSVLCSVVFIVVGVLFLQFSGTYFSTKEFTHMLSQSQGLDGMIYTLLDGYVLMCAMLILYILCAVSFLSQLWNDDVADYYILLLLWSLTFYILYGLNRFNSGTGIVSDMIGIMADTLYQFSAIPLFLCLYIRTERYRGFVRSVLVLEYALCVLFALFSVSDMFPAVLVWIEFACDLLFCCALAGVLFLGYKEALQGNGFYRLFCFLVSSEIIVMLAVTLIAVILDGNGLYLQRNVLTELLSNFNLHPLREYYLQKFVLFTLLVVLFIRLFSEQMHSRSTIRVLSYEKESAQGYAAAVRERIDEVRRVKHDTMLHINVCNMLYAQEEYQRLGEYLQKLQTDGQAIAPLQYSNNLMIDYIVMSFSRKAEQKQISMQTDIEVLPELSISDSDLCSLLNNILQNAFDACSKLPEPEKRWIRLEIRADENKVYFTCINSCDGFVIRSNGKYLTTKEDGVWHGYGMSIIRGLCHHNGGAMAAQLNGNRFTVKVALPYHLANIERGIHNEIQKENQ